MRKPARSRVLLITGSHVSALDFNLLLENLSREHVSGGGGAGARRHRSRDREQDGRCGTAWPSEDDLAPARDFINRQHGAGEPWFCYVNPCLQPEPCRRARSSALVGPKAKPGRARPGKPSSSKPGRSR
jgi:hypothetical protein